MSPWCRWMGTKYTIFCWLILRLALRNNVIHDVHESVPTLKWIFYVQESQLLFKVNPRKLCISDLYSYPHDAGKRHKIHNSWWLILKKKLIAFVELSHLWCSRKYTNTEVDLLYVETFIAPQTRNNVNLRSLLMSSRCR